MTISAHTIGSKRVIILTRWEVLPNKESSLIQRRQISVFVSCNKNEISFLMLLFCGLISTVSVFLPELKKS